MFKLNALEVQFGKVSRIQVSKTGEIYVCCKGYNVSKINIDGSVSIVLRAGQYNGDGKPGCQTNFSAEDICLDEENNCLYVAGEHRILKVELDGCVSTVVGDGTCGTLGNKKLAVNGQVEYPQALCKIGDELYFCDHSFPIRKIDKNEKLGSVFSNNNIHKHIRTIHKTPKNELLFLDTNDYYIKKISHKNVENVLQAPNTTAIFQMAPDGDVYACIDSESIRNISKKDNGTIVKKEGNISTFTISPSGEIYYSAFGVIRKVDCNRGDIPVAGVWCHEIEPEMSDSIITSYDDEIDRDPIYKIAFPLIDQLKKSPGNLNAEIIHQLDKLSKCEITVEKFMDNCASYSDVEIVWVLSHIKDELRTLSKYYENSILNTNNRENTKDIYKNMADISKEFEYGEQNEDDIKNEIFRTLKRWFVGAETGFRFTYSNLMENLLDHKQSHDIVVICGEKEIPAHRPILAKAVMLNALFNFGENDDYYKSPEKNKYVLKIDEKFVDVLPFVISYCYGKYVKLENNSIDTVVKYIELAQMYELYSLMELIYNDYVSTRFNAKNMAKIMDVMDPCNGNNRNIVRNIVASYLERETLRLELKKSSSVMHRFWIKRVDDITNPDNQKTNKRKKEMEWKSDKQIAKKLKEGCFDI